MDEPHTNPQEESEEAGVAQKQTDRRGEERREEDILGIDWEEEFGTGGGTAEQTAQTAETEGGAPHEHTPTDRSTEEEETTTTTTPTETTETRQRRRADRRREEHRGRQRRGVANTRAAWFASQVLTVEGRENHRCLRNAAISNTEKIKIGNWNVTGILEAGKILTVIKHMEKKGISIMFLTETHCKEPDTYMTEEGYMVVHSADGVRDEKGKPKQMFTGVSAIIAPKIRAAVQEIMAIDGRKLTLTVDSAQAPLRFLVIYAPHQGREQEVREKFWEEVEEEIEGTPDSTDLIILGDWNSPLPKEEEGEEGGMIGPFPHRGRDGGWGFAREEEAEEGVDPTGAEEEIRNEELVAQMCERQGLCFPQTWMQKNWSQIWTHQRPGSGDRVQLDHTVCRRAWKGSVLDISTDHAAGLNSNHRLVINTVRAKRGAKRKTDGRGGGYDRNPTEEQIGVYRREVKARWTQNGGEEGPTEELTAPQNGEEGRTDCRRGGVTDKEQDDGGGAAEETETEGGLGEQPTAEGGRREKRSLRDEAEEGGEEGGQREEEQSPQTQSGKFDSIAKGILTAAKVSFPMPKKKPRKPWISQKTLEKIEERNQMQARDAPEQQQRDINKLIKKEAKKDKKDWLLSQLKDTAKAENAKEKWKWVKRIKKPYAVHTTKLKDKEGKTAGVLSSQEVFADYLENKHWAKPQQEFSTRREERFPQAEVEEGPFTAEEVRQTIKQLKNGRCAGDDEITAELYKYLSTEDWAMEELAEFFTQVFHSRVAPEQWDVAVVVEIFKGKGAHSDPEMYRPISLLSTAYKIYARMIQKRLAAAMDHRLRRTQFGFRKGRSCTQPLFVLHRLIEAALESSQSLHLLFLDWAKAFDKISHSGLISALRRFGVPDSFVDAITAIYANPQFKVRVNGRESGVHRAGSGIRQGCPLSPYLFLFLHSMIMEDVDREVEEHFGHKPWVHSAANPVTDLAYADDTLVVARTAEVAETILHSIQRTAKQYGLELNLGKCEVVQINSQQEIAFFTEDQEEERKIVKRVEQAKYLGLTVDRRGRMKADLTARLGRAQATLNMLAKFWSHSDINRQWKLRVYSAVIVPMIAYGLHTVRLVSTEERKIDAFHHRALRKVMGIKATYFTEVLEPHRKTWTNKEVREEAGLPLLTEIIRAQRLRLLGHVLRGTQEQLEHSVCFTDCLNYRTWRKTQSHHKRTQLQYAGNSRGWLKETLGEAWEAARAQIHRQQQEGAGEDRLVLEEAEEGAGGLVAEEWRIGGGLEEEWWRWWRGGEEAQEEEQDTQEKEELVEEVEEDKDSSRFWEEFLKEWEEFYTGWYDGSEGGGEEAVEGEEGRGEGGGEAERGRGETGAEEIGETERAGGPHTAGSANQTPRRQYPQRGRSGSRGDSGTDRQTDGLASSSNSALTALFPNRDIVHPNDTLALRSLALHRGLWRSTMDPR